MAKKDDHKKKPDPAKKKLSETFREFEMDIDMPNLRKRPKLRDEAPAEAPVEEPAETRPLFKMANELLPKTGPIKLVLKEMSDMHVANLTMATIIEEAYRNRLPADTVDCLTVAALLSGSRNAPQIAHKFSEETLITLSGYVNIALPDAGEPTPYEAYPENARRVFQAMIAAELHLTQKALRAQQTLPVNQDLGIIATHIIRESVTAPKEKKASDIAMLQRLVKEYNAVTSAAGVPVILVMNADNTVSGYNRNAPRPPKPGF